MVEFPAVRTSAQVLSYFYYPKLHTGIFFEEKPYNAFYQKLDVFCLASMQILVFINLDDDLLSQRVGKGTIIGISGRVPYSSLYWDVLK